MSKEKGEKKAELYGHKQYGVEHVPCPERLPRDYFEVIMSSLKSKLQSNYSSQKESQSLLQKGANPARHSQKKM